MPTGRRSLSFRFKLVPSEPCVLRAPPARLVCRLAGPRAAAHESPSYFYNHFFEAAGESEAHELIYLTASVPEITVQALAETGRNARFAEIVGPCDLRASVVPTQLVVGQQRLFTVHLDNLAFARHITGLPAAAFDGLRPEFQLSAEPIRKRRRIKAAPSPASSDRLRPGIARIPAVVIQTFDPDSGEYRTLRSTPISITVEPDPEDASRTVTPPIDAKPPIPLTGVRHNRSSEQTMISFRDILEFLGRYWWAIVPLPPLLWLALCLLARCCRTCRRDPVYARAIAACGDSAETRGVMKSRPGVTIWPTGWRSGRSLDRGHRHASVARPEGRCGLDRRNPVPL